MSGGLLLWSPCARPLDVSVTTTSRHPMHICRSILSNYSRIKDVERELADLQLQLQASGLLLYLSDAQLLHCLCLCHMFEMQQFAHAPLPRAHKQYLSSARPSVLPQARALILQHQ